MNDPGRISALPFVVIGSVVSTIGIVLGVLLLGLLLFLALLPWIVQPFLRLVLFFRYDLRRLGLENIPKTGPVLIASNHVTWFDGFFLAATLPRRGTALVNAGAFAIPVIGFLARRCGLIPVPYKGPKAQRAAIETCRKALEANEALAIFPRVAAQQERDDGAILPGSRGDPGQATRCRRDPGLHRQWLG